MNKYKIIALCGKSAAGKDTVLRGFIQNCPEVHEIINCTSRPPREGEVNGKNYFFYTLNEMHDSYLAGRLLTATQFREWVYGTSEDGLSIDKVNVGVFNPESVRHLLENEKVEVYTVLVVASDKMRLLRSLNREENPDVDEIVRRYLADKEDFENVGFSWNYIIENHGQGVCPKKMASVVTKILEEAEDHWAE